MYKMLVFIIALMVDAVRGLSKSKKDLVLENLALRQSLANFKAKRKRPKITDMDRLFWIALKQTWSKWIDALIIFKPETVINWQKKRFKDYWYKISFENRKPGRPRIKKEIRDLIYRMAGENNWGAPTIYEELLKLGFDDISERTVARYLRSFRSKYPDKRKSDLWKVFLKNHRHETAAMDFFVVSTFGLKLFYCFFIIHHNRREILHFNVTRHPTALWVCQQLREAFPYDRIPKYLIFDRDSIFSPSVKKVIKNTGIKKVQTSYQSPWQNGVAERWILSVRSELLNHLVILDEDHLRRKLKEYVGYYNNDRCHLSVNKDSPRGRPIQKRPSTSAKVISIPKIGGLVHKYEWRDAA